MVQKRFLFCVFYLTLFSFGYSQTPTVGLISYDISQTYQGYTMIYPFGQPNVYLINNCGEVVHTWAESSIYEPANVAYLQDDGSLFKTKRNNDVSNDVIWAGGGGAFVEHRSWDNDLLWSFELNNADYRLHHDIAVKPNGNVLMIVWERILAPEAFAQGRDPGLLTQNELWSEKIIEVDPSTDQIVWEWRVLDHIIQDIDANLPNYGVVADHPEKININWDNNAGLPDWLHVNAIDYNPELRQIMISSPLFNEIWVIDNTTTTQQAAGNVGGDYFKGGGLLYRLGNQQAYNKGGPEDQLFFYQHDAHWTNKFIDINHPKFGHMLCFNNRIGTDYSAMEIFESSYNMYSVSYESFQGTYPPYSMDNSLLHPEPTSFYSRGLSSIQLLPNGNFLGCSGRQGYIVELTPDNRLVWEYVAPFKFGFPVDQGTQLVDGDSKIFRAFKYPLDYVAFEGRDLSSKGFLESLAIEDWCDRLLPTSTPVTMNTKIYPNPSNNMLHLTWDSGKIVEIKVVDLLGRIRLETKGNGGMKYLNTADFEPGSYYILIDGRVVDKLLISR